MPKSEIPLKEADLHKSVSEFLDWMLLPPALYTTFPAGWTAMRKGAAGRLKAAGLKPGMPDLLVFFGGKTIGLELKANAIVSKAQLELFPKLEAAGVSVHLCRDLDSVWYNLSTVHAVPMRPYNYGYPSNVPPAEARRKAESTQSTPQPTQETLDALGSSIKSLL